MSTKVATVTITGDWRSWRPLRPELYGRASSERPADSAEQPTVERNRILVGDALAMLHTLPSAAVDCVITSPPYFLLRDYGVRDQLGAETNVGGYVDRLVAVCDEVARVLKPTGTLWLNLGDSYSRHTRYGATPKSLLLAPERLLLQLAERGWIVRNKLVWAKPNPMPSSVRDRLSCTWEPLYLLVRSEHYFFDLDAIREPHTTTRKPARGVSKAKYGGKRPAWAGPLAGANDGLTRAQAEGRSGHPLGKNPGDVWTVATAGFRGAHFATFPPRLIERPILAAVPERVCTACGTPWRRMAKRLLPECECRAAWQPGVVLDPFMGAGTVAVAALAQGRDWLGIELNAEYAQLALQRTEQAREERWEERSPRQTTRWWRDRRLVGGMRPTVSDHTPSDRRPHHTEEEDAGHVHPHPHGCQRTREEVKPVKTLAIRLEDDVHAQLQVIAKLQESSIADEIRQAIDAHLEAKRSDSDLSSRAAAVLESIEAEAKLRQAAIADLFSEKPHDAAASKAARPKTGRS